MSLSSLIFPQLLLFTILIVGISTDLYSTKLFTRKYGWAYEQNWLPRQAMKHPILQGPYMGLYFMLGFYGISLAVEVSIFLAVAISIIPLIFGSLNQLQYSYKYPRYHSVLGLNDVRG